MAPGDTLAVGRKLVVWTNASDIEEPRMSPTAALGNTTRKLRYTVRNGDSLYLIASRFRVTIAQLTRWNKIWLGALVVSVLALVVTLVLLLRNLQPPEPMLPPMEGETEELAPAPR